MPLRNARWGFVQGSRLFPCDARKSTRALVCASASLVCSALLSTDTAGHCTEPDDSVYTTCQWLQVAKTASDVATTDTST